MLPPPRTHTTTSSSTVGTTTRQYRGRTHSTRSLNDHLHLLQKEEDRLGDLPFVDEDDVIDQRLDDGEGSPTDLFDGDPIGQRFGRLHVHEGTGLEGRIRRRRGGSFDANDADAGSNVLHRRRYP